MSTLYWGKLVSDGDITPQDVEKVTRNTPPVQVDGPAKEMPHAPDYNEFFSDPDPELGFTGHQLASDWRQPAKYAPGLSGDLATEQGQPVARLNEQQALKGTAAQRENSGQYGHGTMAFAVGIEPTIRDGAAYGNDYFAAHKDGANPTTTYDTGIQPITSTDNMTNSRVSAAGKGYARDAYMDSVTGDLYANFLKG